MSKKHYDIDVRTEQIQDMVYPQAIPPIVQESLGSRIKRKFITREGWIGDYDYRALW